MKLNLDMDNQRPRKLRRAVSILVAGEKLPKPKKKGFQG